MRMIRRRIMLAPALALALGLASCHSSMEKADAWEGQYDRMMANQAYGAALMAIKKSISYDDTTARRYIKLAQLQMQAGMTAGAAASFQAALDLEPDNIEALENLSILAVRGGQFDAAQRYIDPLLALNPDDPAGLLASGMIALNQHRFKEASVRQNHHGAAGSGRRLCPEGTCARRHGPDARCDRDARKARRRRRGS
jgi:tetratricopeptide (TPR) repeat protein